MKIRKRSDSVTQFAKRDCEFFKVDGAHGIAYGWAIVSTVDGEPYFDTQGDHIPMSACIRAAENFMKYSRAGDEQHDERRAGDVPFAMPVTSDIAKSLFGLGVNQEGLVIGFKPYDASLLAKIENGERRGFSIGGTLSKWISKCKPITMAARGLAKRFEKATDGKRIFEDFQIDFISAVDWPAQEGALVALVKSVDGNESHEPVLWMRKAVMPPQKKPQQPGAVGTGTGGVAGAAAAMYGMPPRSGPPQMPARPGQQAMPPQAFAQQPAPMPPMGMIGMSPQGPQPGAGMGGSLGVPQSKLTGEADGHQHTMLFDEVDENGVGYTGFGISSVGVSHRHAFVIDPMTQQITIAMNDGHTHSPDGSAGQQVDENGDPIDPEDLLDNGADENAEDDNTNDNGNDSGASDGNQPAAPAQNRQPSQRPQFGAQPNANPDDKQQPKKKPFGAPPFAPRKRDMRSAGQNETTGLASVTKEHEMKTPEQIKIEQLEKQLKDAQAFGELNDAQKAYFKSLSITDQPVFLAKSAADRGTEIEKSIAYRCDDGTVIYKWQGEILEKMARQNDETRGELRKQREENEALQFEKRAVEKMKFFPKTPKIKALILKAIDSATQSTKDGKVVIDEAVRKEAYELLDAGNKAMSRGAKRFGKNVDSGADEVDESGDDPETKLDSLAKKYAKENKVSFHKAYDAVIETEEGQALYAEANGVEVDLDDDGAVDDFEDDDGEVVEETA